MLKSSKNESDKIKELGLTMKELKSIARKIGVKNFENLSRVELVKEIDKLEPPKELKKKKITSSLLLKGKKNIGFKPKKSKPKKDVHKPIKISGAFSDNFVEYQSNGNRDKSISIARYLNNIRENLKKLINDQKKNGEWKIQLIMKIDFISSRNFIESRDIYSKSDNFEIMMGAGGNTNEIIRNLFNSILRRYQGGLQESMRGSEFVFDYAESLKYIFQKIDLKRSGSYIETPEWLKNKGATTNCQNDDDKCFQYAITIALNYDEIGNHHQRVNKVKPFIDQYNWKDINFPSHVDDWKKFELNSKSVALNVLYVPEDEKTIRHAYK